MKTLEKLWEEYNNLNKKRNAIYKKIEELEQQEVNNKFTIGECYLDTYCKSFKKVIVLDGNVLYCMVVNNESILREKASEFLLFLINKEKWLLHNSFQ